MYLGCFFSGLFAIKLEYLSYSKLNCFISTSTSSSSVNLNFFQNFFENTLLNPSTSPLFHGLLGATYNGDTPTFNRNSVVSVFPMNSYAVQLPQTLYHYQPLAHQGLDIFSIIHSAYGA